MVLEDVKLISARRAYEFRPDDIRLSAVCAVPVQQMLRDAFQFQLAVVATPGETFGPVPITLPAGLVLNGGVLVSGESSITPIRFLHFEQRRIVIDIAGPSSVVTTIYERVRELLDQVDLSVGAPVVGEPVSVRDYSDYTVRGRFEPSALIPTALRKVFTRRLSADGPPESLALVPTLYVQLQSPASEYTGPSPENRTLEFSLRVGTPPEARVYFSGVYLDSDAHRELLEEVVSALTSRA